MMELPFIRKAGGCVGFLRPAEDIGHAGAGARGGDERRINARRRLRFAPQVGRQLAEVDKTSARDVQAPAPRPSTSMA